MNDDYDAPGRLWGGLRALQRVVLQPAASRDAQRHYMDTVVQSVRLDEHQSQIAVSDYEQLLSIFPGGAAALWGVTPGANGRNAAEYGKASVGDVVLFAANRRIFSGGVIAHLFRSEPLASSLWGHDDAGATRELMYALDEVRQLDISYAALAQTVGYSAGFVVQGFRVLDADLSSAAIAAFDLASRRHVATVSESDFQDAIAGLDGPLDRRVQRWVRAEQKRARDALIGSRLSASCFLCGREFPTELLVAAHKKKRAACTDEEKRDLKNVVMLCCVLGCDQLYELGYVSVDSRGRVLQSTATPLGPAYDYVWEVMLDRVSISDVDASYFAWHRRHTFRTAPSETAE